MRQIVWASILGSCLFTVFGVSWSFGQTQARAEYTSFDLRDPFKKQFLEQSVMVGTSYKPKAKEQIMPPKIVVEGIIFGGPTPYAIVGGKPLRTGDKVGEAVITDITKEGIEVEYRFNGFVYPSPAIALKSAQGVKNAE